MKKIRCDNKLREHIKKNIKKKGKTMYWLAEQLGLTEAAFHQRFQYNRSFSPLELQYMFSQDIINNDYFDSVDFN